MKTYRISAGGHETKVKAGNLAVGAKRGLDVILPKMPPKNRKVLFMVVEELPEDAGAK